MKYYPDVGGRPVFSGTTADPCKDEWMEEARRCQTWYYCTWTAIGKFINQLAVEKIKVSNG